MNRVKLNSFKGKVLKAKLSIKAIKYIGILLISTIAVLLIAKVMADCYGSVNFKYEYFYTAIINFIIGFSIFNISLSYQKFPKFIGLVIFFLLLLLVISVLQIMPAFNGVASDYYYNAYIIATMRYVQISCIFGIILSSYYVKNAWKYVATITLLILFAYFISERIKMGFYLDIILLPIITLILLPGLIATRPETETKFQFIHKLFLPYISIATTCLMLRPYGLTGSDYVIEPCAISIAVLAAVYSIYYQVKYKKAKPQSFYRLLWVIFLLSITIRTTLTILRAGWV